jgi:hypothetical protein
MIPRKLPEDSALQVSVRCCGYEYNNPSVLGWHVNFADAELFGFYGGLLSAKGKGRERAAV